MTAANANRPVRSIAVVGGGVVARGAALAFARALPGVAVTLVSAPVPPGALSDWFPVLTASARGALDRWGLDEAALLRSGCALPRLGARFDAWGSDAPWLWAEGEPVSVPGAGALHQRWLRAARHAAMPPFHALFPAAAMAEAVRFASDPAAPLDRADYGLRFDARQLAEALTAQADRAGVRRPPALFAEAVRDVDGRIATVRLADGAGVAADLFVDASGPAALLGGEADAREDWSGALPADRLLIAAAAPLSDLVDRYRCLPSGWTAHWPGPRRSVDVVAYASALGDEAAARRALPDPSAPAASVAVAPGRRERFWSGNCLSIGEAAAAFGALSPVGFAFAQAQVALALELLPPRAMPARLLGEYDRLATARADRLRDWLAAHHLAGAGPFWSGVRPPPTLAATLDRFARRGSLPYLDGDGEGDDVRAAAWHAVLIGQGIRPRIDDAIAMAGDPATLARDLTRQADRLADAAAALPAGPYRSGDAA